MLALIRAAVVCVAFAVSVSACSDPQKELAEMQLKQQKEFDQKRKDQAEKLDEAMRTIKR